MLPKLHLYKHVIRILPKSNYHQESGDLPCQGGVAKPILPNLEENSGRLNHQGAFSLLLWFHFDFCHFKYLKIFPPFLIDFVLKQLIQDKTTKYL